MKKSWLKHKVEDIEAVENESVERLKQSRPDRPAIHIPFGFLNKSWNELKNCMKEGDELWFFSSEDYTWETLRGREGYTVLRNGEPHATLNTRLT
jgi:hypothetical protein